MGRVGRGAIDLQRRREGALKRWQEALVKWQNPKPGSLESTLSKEELEAKVAFVTGQINILSVKLGKKAA